MSQQYLANATKEILKKYENVNSVKTIDDIEVLTVDKQDLDFLLGYTVESLRIETEYKEEIEQLREALQRACNSLGADMEDYL